MIKGNSNRNGGLLLLIEIARAKTEGSSSNRKQTLIVTILILILLLSLSNIIQENINYSNELLVGKTSVPILRDNSKNNYPRFPINLPSFAIQPFPPRILFIVKNSSSPDSTYDQPFFEYMNSTLNYTVTYHDSNDSYSYEGYDAIVISDSIDVDQVSSLANASIPILIMESFTYSVFRIASGRGSTNDDSLYILNSNHFITVNETNATDVTVYTSKVYIQFLKGYTNEPVIWSEIDSLAQRTLHQTNERTLIALDKGRKDWDNVSTAERRTFWGATQGNILTQKGWELWNRTLRWILYDDMNGSATININVKDLDNKDVPNAEVNLTHSYDTNQNFSQSTTVEGQTTFTNIPYGTYNITVEFEDSINDTFSLINITGEQAFNLTANFDFTVRINEYIDNDPPIISNIGFFLSNKTFHAEVYDASALMMVNLSLTASNATPFTRKGNYTMVTTDGVFYYNDTAAHDLSAVNVTYNITAIDIAGNIRISETYSFLLGDNTPPTIYEYNVTDYENGTLQFYANITDSQSDVQDPVILRINESFAEMHLNASGYWVYRTQAYYDITLNYTIWSANDSVGNENGTRKFSLTPKFGLVTPKDNIYPHIWGVSDTSTVHENGYVEFTSYVDDWNEFQSGTNKSSVQLTLSVNGVNISHIMTPIGAITYYYEFTFNFEDTVYYWVNASDLARNIEQGDIHGFNITDNAIPIVTYWAEEWGNGTVDFHAEVIDWPNNKTTTFVSYTQNWFDTPWPNITMTEFSESQFSTRVNDTKFQLQDIWYYVTAVDSSGNSYEPTLDQSLNITVTDKVPPIITFTIENSTLNDGEITVVAHATDEFGTPAGYVDNTFYINMSQDVVNTPMDYDGFYHYTTTHSFPYEDLVTIIVWVQDDSGNLGIRNRTIIIGDYTPPKITRWGPIVYQNGTVKIWAEINEGVYGSGLADDNSSVTIDYIFISPEIATMTWNGSGNFFTYSISGFNPENAFTYRIKAIDKSNNANITDWEPVSILDLTPPVYKAFDHSEELVNCTASELHFWAEVEDPFGSILCANITLNYFDGSQWLNWTSEMIYNGSHYIYSIQFIRNNSFSYNLQIYDEALNINETPILSHKTLDFQPSTALDYGVEFSISELKAGEGRFWILVDDTSEEYSLEDHFVNLSVRDETLGMWIINKKLMKSNGTHYIYNLSIPYLHNFSYVMQLIDGGVLGGYYDPSQYSNSSQMLDYWRPIIVSSGIDQVNETTIIVWANVSDWGSGVTDVNLSYEFKPIRSNGGAGSQFNEIRMEFNESLYIAELTFSETGTLTWFIEAYDIRDSSISSQEEYTFLSQTEQPELFGLTLLQIILIIIVTVLVLTIILFGGRTFQRKRSVTYYKTQEIKDKLAIIPNVYTILVSTEVGVPILTVTNILYQKDESLDDALSGLSVGIDTFLQSFQSDFMQQVQQQSSEYSTEMGKDENIRISVIEQHQIQIMIIASQNYRIFVFLKEKPSIFVREVFYKAIKDIEKNIFIPNLGIVDETLFGPQVETILRKNFPITLLMPFIIDIAKLTKFDEELKRGLRPVPISRAGINALKRLVVTQTISKMRVKNPQAEIKLFDDVINKGLLKDIRKILYNDARNIMSNLLKIPNEIIHEALWTGSSPDVNIVIPHEDSI